MFKAATEEYSSTESCERKMKEKEYVDWSFREMFHPDLS